MSNDISKHISFSLDVKSSKVKKDKLLVVNVGDSVTLDISLIEDGLPKNISGCNIDLIVANEDITLNSIIHRYSQGGITISDDVDGEVKIECKNSYINRLGINLGQLIISDMDQQVLSQKFMFVTNPTLLGDLIEEAKEEVDSLAKLELIIEKLSEDIKSIENKNLLLEKSIDDTKVIIDEKLKNLESDIELKSKEIDDRIKGIDDTVNYSLVKIKELNPVILSASTTIGFETEPINTPVENLVKCGYMVHISGSVSSSSIVQSSTSCLGFYQEVVSSESVVKCRLFTFMDISVQGKMLTPSVWFVKEDGSVVDNIPVNETNYKILIKANIHKNNIEKAACKLSPLSSILQ